jgi:PAS domain S-box-containing protein
VAVTAPAEGDLPDRRTVDEELRRRDAQLRTLIEELHSGVALIDGAGRFTLFNHRFLEIFGLPPDADVANVNAQEWSEWRVFDEAGRPLSLDEHPARLAVRTRTPVRDQLVAVYLPRGGEPRWLLISAEPVLGEDGAIEQVICTYFDLTAQRLASEAARRSEERAKAQAVELEAILACVGDGVVVYDRQGRTVRSTPAADRILGMSLEERRAPVAERVMEQYVITAEDGHRVLPGEMVAIRAAVHGETVEDAVQRVQRGAGAPRWLRMNARPLVLDGEHRGAVLSMDDITERKTAEEALREANRRLREEAARRDEFLGMLSHELRNPLAPIRNAAYVLEHADPGSEQAERARGILRRQSEHLTRLVDDLLDATRITRGKITLRRMRTDLRLAVARAADEVRARLLERGVAFRVEATPEAVWADVDPTRLNQVLVNLLHNAAKFTRHGDEVALSLRLAGERAELRVRDTGAGIEAALLPQLFEPFVQGDRTLARSEGGLGLGLALVKGIVELHAGEVRAESAGVGKGSDFVVLLPVHGGPAAPAEAPAASPSGAVGRRVLVVDDNADAADSLAEILRLVGYQPEVAYDGAGALAALEATRPEVVLCDIGLPGMSGYDVARAVRGQGLGVRLVALSGYARAEDVRRALEAGFDAHVAKPPDIDELVRLLG